MILLQGLGRAGYMLHIALDRSHDILLGIQADHAEQAKQLRIRRAVRFAYFVRRNLLHIDGPGNAVDNPVRNSFPRAAVGLG